MASILIVEDEASMRRILSVLLQGDGHHVREAESLAVARGCLKQHQFDLVVTDQKLGDGYGLQLLADCAEADPALPVILVTAFATVDLAVQAMREGAFDFITKPFEPDAVLAAVTRAYRHGALMRENRLLKGERERLEAGNSDLLGDSAAMRETRSLIERVAPTDSTVLITGETGTGKELVARMIHKHSRRAKQPFIAVNCAAMPETLLESQLFGHEKGAFTGADRPRQGLFEAAHGGTLFLDEAGEMPPALQAKLLRVLMDGEVMRVGATTARHVDVRILVATHRDLESRVKEELFREDLYYRLAVVPVPIPPLRNRKEDLPRLAEFFLGIVAAELKVPRKTLSDEAMDLLRKYHFPGNVRELRNLVERAYILGNSTKIVPDDLPIRPHPARSGPDLDDLSIGHETADLRATLDHVEAELITRALAESRGNQAQAARALGISRSDMNYKLKKHGLRNLLPS